MTRLEQLAINLALADFSANPGIVFERRSGEHQYTGSGAETTKEVQFIQAYSALIDEARRILNEMAAAPMAERTQDGTGGTPPCPPGYVRTTVVVDSSLF